MTHLEKVQQELKKYEHPLLVFTAREKGEAVELRIDFRSELLSHDIGLHTYVYEFHPRDLAHPQFAWTFQRQLYDCLHDYLIEMFTLTPQMK